MQQLDMNSESLKPNWKRHKGSQIKYVKVEVGSITVMKMSMKV